MSLMSLIAGLLGIVIGIVVSYFIIISLIKSKKIKSIEENKKKAEQLIERAQETADKIKKEAEFNAKEKYLSLKSDLEKSYNEKQDRLNNFERRLLRREDNLEKKASTLENKERDMFRKERYIKSREQELENQKSEYNKLIEKQKEELFRVAEMSREEAKEKVLKKVEEEVQSDVAGLLNKVQEEYERKKENMAKEIMAAAIQSNAADYVIESTVSVVDLPSDDMKGRIIGREGRNIRALEMQTGTNLIIDDTPEAVIISCSNPIRREVARRALKRLVNDGRINPVRIEDVVKDTRKKFEESLKEEGESIVMEFNLKNVHPELVSLLGKLRYRTSYGQNVLEHSKEVATYAGKIAAEIGANEEIAIRGGLFHDIGKAVDREVGGTHLELGVKLARKYGESEEVVNAIKYHHQDMNFPSVESMIVQAADTLSAARPGVRREVLEVYLKRLENLENLAVEFDGVRKAYALQAGREVRIIVNSDEVYDEQAIILARDIVKKIENELEYPGQIKVTVVREKRIVEYAK